MKVNLKNYHDWYIVGAKTDIEKDVLELLVGFENNRSLIRFSGVKRCRIDNFMIGNIMLDLYIYSGPGCKKKLKISKAFNSLFLVSKESVFYEKCLNSIVDEKLLYVEISPSYGCSAMIVCEEVEEKEINEI